MAGRCWAMCHVGASTSTRSTLASPKTGSSASIFFLSCTSHMLDWDHIRRMKPSATSAAAAAAAVPKLRVLARYMRCCLNTYASSS